MCFGDSLVEEGEQVSHDDEGFVWQRLEDLFDVNGPLLEALHCWNTHVTGRGDESFDTNTHTQ